MNQARFVEPQVVTAVPQEGELIEALLEGSERSRKPRTSGLTVMLDKGTMGPRMITELAESCGRHCDMAKIAWGSALVEGNLRAKLEAYRAAEIQPMLGGTLFEYAFLRNRVPILLDLVKALDVHIEISDGVIDLPRRDRLHWIERFARVTRVYSEIGGKTHCQVRDWMSVVAEDLAAGADKIVVEGREIGPVGQDIRDEFVEEILRTTRVENLVFEAMERPQQVWLIKKLGPNVNVANVLPSDVLTVESFRLGLKENTLLHRWG